MRKRHTEVGSESDASDTGGAALRDVERGTGEPQSEGHEGETDEEELTSAENIDGLDSGETEEPVASTPSERSGESSERSGASRLEDGA